MNLNSLNFWCVHINLYNILLFTFAFHFFHFDFFWKSGKVIFSLFKRESESGKVKKSLFKSDSESEKVKKSLFHFSGKSLKVKKVKSESDYFSLSNVWSHDINFSNMNINLADRIS